MAYLRPYVNNMLKNHLHGDKFKEVRRLAYRVGTYIPPSPDPEEGERTREQNLYLIGMIIIGIIVKALFSSDEPQLNRRNGKWGNDRKYFEPLRQKMSELMDVLDYSKDSIWLVTYMVEEGVSGCPYAVSVFEDYLEKC